MLDVHEREDPAPVLVGEHVLADRGEVRDVERGPGGTEKELRDAADPGEARHPRERVGERRLHVTREERAVGERLVDGLEHRDRERAAEGLHQARTGERTEGGEVHRADVVATRTELTDRMTALAAKRSRRLPA